MAPLALPPALDRRFEATVLWSSGPPKPSTLSTLASLGRAAALVGVVAPVSSKDLATQLGSLVSGQDTIFIADSRDARRGSCGSRGDGPARRPWSQSELAALDQAASILHETLAGTGLMTKVLARQPNAVRIAVRLVHERAEMDTTPSIKELLLAHGIPGLPSLADLALDAAHSARIEDPRVKIEGAKVEIALEDAGDAVLGVLEDLWRCGVDPQDVLLLLAGMSGVPHRPAPVLVPDMRSVTVVVEDRGRAVLLPEAEPLGDGRRGLDALLYDQLERRHRRALPEPTFQPGWAIVVEGFDAEMQRVHEALLATSDGHFGFSGSPLTTHPNEKPWAIAGGVYQGTGSESRLLTAPIVFRLGELTAPVPLRRVLDLRTGVLHERSGERESRFDSARFVSLTRSTTTVLRARHPSGHLIGEPLLSPSDDPVHDHGRTGDTTWLRVAATEGGLVAAAHDGTIAGASFDLLDRIGVYRLDPDSLPESSPVVEAVSEIASIGFDRLLREHREQWADRWENADVVIEGDDELQLGIRLSLFHLMASVASSGQAAVGARGLTGAGYRGHVFWDADIFVLPFLAATHPTSARAMLEYRLRRLPAAREAARELGRSGARFPWESARTGSDVTPTSARDRSGRVVPIRTGQLEEHIVSDVAWAACCYTDWTGDEEFAGGPGLRILVETARYWASRIRVESDRSAHIYGVIGPDEYHEPVDDNAFTNVMARWNLRRAARALDVTGETRTAEVEPSERSRWLELADALVDGYDPDTGIYEQFAGFSSLEPLIISEVAPRRPIAADLLLGAERVRSSQVVKQADVLMLHHLVPDEVVRGSLEPNLRYYEPRTSHGSSLSPAIHASLLARARDFEPALEALRIAARMDLDDLSGSSGQGLHVATMGGLWQALAFGFAGLRPRAGMLHVDPILPPSWGALELRVRFLGSRVRIRQEKSELSITTDQRIAVVVEETPFTVEKGTMSFRRHGPHWEPVQ